ncbi:MAG TPA: SulP family inorganic anion transporter [Casimicrobiaceae bacterium]|nr:SulP family inorganic anion transporter [Casimicrobiaceae bacterium]
MADKAAAGSPDVGPVPKDWIAGLKENFRFDVLSGFILFLIALPLSLGIAIASGFPPIAGLITAAIGGMLGALISGSYITINGPAAGLIVIVYGAVIGLGLDPATGQVDMVAGCRYALAVGVVCGAVQIAMGLARMGKLTNMFPLNVVLGMLAGIGIIIMAKQIHVALGITVSGGMIATIAAIPSSFINMVPLVALIGAVSLAIMILWPKLGKISRFVPAPLVVVIVTVPLGIAFNLDNQFLVQVPLNFMDSFAAPDWGKAGTNVFWKFVITYVVVASLESLLTAAAMDKMDPWKRRSNMNQELIGKGAANSLSSFLGGLPMIAEVVRSSANIMNGARTRWSNFFHGFFLALSVALLPAVLNMIPLAALAGMLVFIGFRLAHPKDFVRAGHTGKEELLYMVVTTVVVVAVDLLWGVVTGLVVALLVNAVRGVRSPKARATVDTKGEEVTLRLQGAHGSLNYVSMRGQLDALPPGKKLTIDYSGVTYMDHTVHERLHDFANEYAQTGGSVKTAGKSGLRATSQSAVSALVRA